MVLIFELDVEKFTVIVSHMPKEVVLLIIWEQSTYNTTALNKQMLKNTTLLFARVYFTNTINQHFDMFGFNRRENFEGMGEKV